MSAKKKSRSESFTEIFNRIECDTGLIFVDTPEETRLIREIYRKYRDQSVQFWSIGQGLHEIDRQKQQVDKFYPHRYKKLHARTGKSGDLDTRINPMNVFSVIEEDCRDKTDVDEDPEDKNIYILRDLDKFFSDPLILRGLKDLIYLCSTSSSTIIVTGFGLTVPNEIEKDTVFVSLNYPTKDEVISEMIPSLQQQIEDHNRVSKEEDRICPDFNKEDVAAACVGLTEDQILNVLQYTTTVDNKVNLDRILDEKKAIINKSDILEYWITKDSLDDIGGFAEIKKWFDVKKAVIKNMENAFKFVAEPPKGMMLLGVQGSGKTACARALAQSWNVGLIKLDIGKVFAGLVGESLAPWEELVMHHPTGEATRLTFEEAYKNKNWIINNPHLGVQSYDRNGKAVFLPVQDVIRHKRTKNLVRVNTKSGRSVDVTVDHSLFTISDEGKLIEMSPSDMKEGTIIAVPSNYAKTNNITTIDLRKEIIGHGDEDKWMVENPLDYLGDEVYKLTQPKSKAQFENGRLLNFSLIPNEKLCSIEKAKIRAKNTETNHDVLFNITKDIAELMGWYTAEGSTTADRLRLHVHKNEVELVEDLIKKCGYNSYSYQDKDSEGCTIFFGDTGLKRIFDYIDITNKDRISEVILSLDEDRRKSYIKGLFSGDGGTSGKHIELSQSRATIVKDIIGLLASVGIFASSYPRLDGGRRIIIHSSIYKRKYIDEIGFSQRIKHTTARGILGENDWGHKIPFYKALKDKASSRDVDKSSKWISYKNAIKLDPRLADTDIYWDTVKSVEILEDQPEYVYDISVPGNENFIAGNIICHNSEKRMRQALAQIDAAGGIVVIDELDKGLSGAGSSDKTDGGTTSRVIGTLLTWLQEDHPGVFLVATANDITNLRRNHPELLRKGRFDEIWFSDVPNSEEREEIFKIHLKKRKRDPKRFDLSKLAEFEYVDTDGLKYPPSGAEIESAVKDAIQERFARGGGKTLTIGGNDDITTEDILEKLAILKPITKIAKETIQSMRRWSSDNARNVSAGESEVKKKKTGKSKINMRNISTEDVNL